MSIEKKKNYRTTPRFYVPLFEIPFNHRPLFKLIRKHSKWAPTHEIAVQRSRHFVLRRVIILVGTWIVWVLLTASNRPYAYSAYTETGLEAIAFVFVISLGLSYLLDMVTVAYTMNSINQEITLGRWDLLRLAMDDEDIISAKYDLARLRTWRLYLLMFSIRLSVAVMFVIVVVVISYLETGEGFLQGYDFFLFITQFTILVAIISYLFLEPFWRVKAITAMGVALSARAKSITMSAIYGFAILISTWILQGVLFGFWNSFYFQFLGNTTSNALYDSVFFEIFLYIEIIIYCVVVIAGTRWFYRFVEISSFGAIRRRLD